jgi:cysteine desulfurase / selenocysteine lyase
MQPNLMCWSCENWEILSAREINLRCSTAMVPSLIDRSQYPGLDDHIYLNQASLGLVGEPAVTAMHRFLDGVARHGNIYMSDSDETGYCSTLRDCSATLLHADLSSLAIVASASEILGQLPFLFRLEKGDRVLAVSSDFPAVTRPWLRQSLFGNGTVRFVDDLPEGDLTGDLIDAMDEHTRVISVSMVQYSTGTTVDVARLARIAAEAGAILIVDATQAAGAVAVDTSTLGADAVITSGYKWLGGHGGVALAVLSERLYQQVPVLPGWMSAPAPFDFDATTVPFASDAKRFTLSTMSYVSVAGLSAAIGQLLAIGEGRIEAHARQLAMRLIEGVREYGWKPFRDIGSVSACPHIIALRHEHEPAAAAIERLRARGIICSARGNRVRISLAPYNDSNDVAAVVDALRPERKG